MLREPQGLFPSGRGGSLTFPGVEPPRIGDLGRFRPGPALYSALP